MNATAIEALAEHLTTHIVDGVTPIGGGYLIDGYLIDCKCGAEINITQGELDNVDSDSTSGALQALMAPHIADAVARFLAATAD